jgi:hypothetical protein
VHCTQNRSVRTIDPNPLPRATETAHNPCFEQKKAVEVTRNGPSLGRKRQLDWRQINDGGIIDAALQYMPLISAFAKEKRKKLCVKRP